MIKKIINIITLVIFLTALGIITARAIDKTELNECQKWQKQAERYPHFNWADWQIEQCK